MACIHIDVAGHCFPNMGSAAKIVEHIDEVINECELKLRTETLPENSETIFISLTNGECEAILYKLKELKKYVSRTASYPERENKSQSCFNWKLNEQTRVEHEQTEHSPHENLCQVEAILESKCCNRRKNDRIAFTSEEFKHIICVLKEMKEQYIKCVNDLLSVKVKVDSHEEAISNLKTDSAKQESEIAKQKREIATLQSDLASLNGKLQLSQQKFALLKLRQMLRGIETEIVRHLSPDKYKGRKGHCSLKLFEGQVKHDEKLMQKLGDLLLAIDYDKETRKAQIEELIISYEMNQAAHCPPDDQFEVTLGNSDLPTWKTNLNELIRTANISCEHDVQTINELGLIYYKLVNMLNSK